MSREEYIVNLCKDLSGVFVEIGTCWGGLAEYLANHTNLSKLYCIDPYAVFPPHFYFDALNFIPQKDLDTKYELVKQRLEKTGKVSLLRTVSYEGCLQIPTAVDFVYIDGNHQHHQVLRDLTIWWNKLRPGGLLAGDDVEDISLPHLDGDLLIDRGNGSFGLYGVATALRDFASICPSFQYIVEGNQFYAWKPQQ